MKWCSFLLLFAGLVLSCHSEEYENALLKVEAPEKMPGLAFQVKMPDLWKPDWFKESTTSIVRIFNPSTGGQEAIVIAASPIPAESRDWTTDKILDETFFKQLGLVLKATVAKRVKEKDWDGAYFEYPLPDVNSTKHLTVKVKNWMRIIDGYLVQFQFYYYLDPSWTKTEKDARFNRLGELFEKFRINIENI